MDEKISITKLNGSTILVVEDDKFLADLLGKRLENTGAQVVHATSGEQAISIIEENSIDLFIIDILLPGTDGFTLLKEIKKIDKYRNSPSFLLSNLQSEEIAKKVKLFDNTKMLLKSNFNLDEIVSEIEKTISKVK